MKNITYEKIETNHLSEYLVKVNGRKLCKVAKISSATRDYWDITETYANKNLYSKFEGKPSNHFPIKKWSDTREAKVISVFPLECGYTYDVDLKKYQY